MSSEQNHIVLGKGDHSIDAFGNQVFSMRRSLTHCLFTYDVSPRLFAAMIDNVDENLTSSTQIKSTNGRLDMRSTGVSGNTVSLMTRRHPRYQPNRAHQYAASIGIPNPTNNAVQDWGMFTPENGAFFRCSVDGELYACIQSGNVVTHQNPITLPDSIGWEDFDVSKGNIYDIDMQWRGVGNVSFFIGHPRTGEMILIHKIILLNTLDEKVSIENPALPIGYRIVSFGDVGQIWSGCADITSSGGQEDRQQYTSFTSGPVTVSTDTPILIIHQPDTIDGKLNTRDIMLSRITINSDKKGDVSFWLTRDPTAIVGGTFNVKGNGSFVEQNITATSVDIAKMEPFMLDVSVEANISYEKVNPDPDKIEFYLIHGDYMIITGSGAAASMNCTVEIGEEI